MTYDRWNVNLWYLNFVEVIYKRRLYIFFLTYQVHIRPMSIVKSCKGLETKYDFENIFTCIDRKNIQNVDLRYKNFKSCFWQSTLTQTYILCVIASVSRLIFQFPMYIKKSIILSSNSYHSTSSHVFNNYAEGSIACWNTFIPSILLW